MTHTLEFLKKYITDNQKLLEITVQKWFPDDPIKAEDALSFVYEKLLEDNARRLRLHDPKRGAKLETYFCVLVNRLIMRHLEQGKSRFREPKWLKKQDNFLWTLVYKKLCYEKLPKAQVVEYVKNSAPGGRNSSVIEEAIWIIYEKFPNCKEPKKREVLTDAGIEIDNRTPLQEEQIMHYQQLEVVHAILNPLDHNNRNDSNKTGIRLIQEKLHHEFKPKTEEHLFLRMIYQDGLSVSKAGRQLGWNVNQASGRHRRLIEKLREIIGDDLKDLI